MITHLILLLAILTMIFTIMGWEKPMSEKHLAARVCAALTGLCAFGEVINNTGTVVIAYLSLTIASMVILVKLLLQTRAR